MAELVISKLAGAVVSQVVETISELLLHEAKSLFGVKDRVKSLQTKLGSMQCLLEDADRQQEQNKSVRHWIEAVKDVAHEVEDVIEIFISKVSSSYFKVCHLYKLKKKINSIQAKIEEISKGAEGYKFASTSREGGPSVAELQQSLRRSYPGDKDDDVISLEDSTKALKGQLMMVENQLRIVSVVGMGGLGKTTLAKKVYNDVKQHFDCYAWAFVSQMYNRWDILFAILDKIEKKEEIREKLRTFKEDELVQRLKENLNEKRYLIVLDDIWEIKAWDCVKMAFPKENQGSKVLFTTRNREVALCADRLSSPIEPPFLTFEESWQLLQRKAFQRDTFGELGFLPKFEELGKEMVKKCVGLPLAIVVLGGLLKVRKSFHEWEEVQRDLNTYLNKLDTQQSYEGVNGILALSYLDLPYYLKPCFLYLSSFPEDCEIPKKVLMQLWIAEGFVQTGRKVKANERVIVEDVAEQYLRELMDRCMIQGSKINNSGVGVKTYRMHDLMRDLCVLKAREEKFFEIIQHQNEMDLSTSLSVDSMPTIYSRRIAIHGRCDFKRYEVQLHLRSVLCFEKVPFPSSILRSKNFMLLRALKLGARNITTKVLKEICKLIHLRYLALWDIEESLKLPNSIGNLRSLQTLDLRGNICLNSLPEGLSRLTRLTHIIPSPLVFQSKVPTIEYKAEWGEGSTTYTGDWLFIKYETFVKLTSLQKLNLVLSKSEEARMVLESPIIKSGSLRSLKIINLSHYPFPSLQSLSSCHTLSRLCLIGEIVREDIHSNFQPHLLKFLPANLAKLRLVESEIHQDPMPVLEKQLPNLRFLELGYDSYRGSEMVCSTGGFPMLESLQLCELNSLKEWQIEKEAMPSLKRLLIDYIPELSMIPEGLKFVTTLRQLDIYEMTESFKDRVRVSEDGTQGEDFYKVRHIPSINFDKP